MHVDIHVELARQVEDAVDLSGMVRIIVRRRADHLRAAVQSLDQQRIRSRIVSQTLLREHAHLNVDRPGVVAPQRIDRLEAAHLHAAIELQMRAHPCRAVTDAFLQRAAGTRVHILDRERVLHRSHTLHRIGLPPVLRRAAVDDAGLVQMDMRLDQAGAGETAVRVEDRAIGLQGGLDRDNPAVRYADINRRCFRRVRKSGVTDDQIHRRFLLHRRDADAAMKEVQASVAQACPDEWTGSSVPLPWKMPRSMTIPADV